MPKKTEIADVKDASTLRAFLDENQIKRIELAKELHVVPQNINYYVKKGWKSRWLTDTIQTALRNIMKREVKND